MEQKAQLYVRFPYTQTTTHTTTVVLIRLFQVEAVRPVAVVLPGEFSLPVEVVYSKFIRFDALSLYHSLLSCVSSRR